MSTQTVMDDPETLSAAVVAAVAEHKGVDPVALESPLYEAIDPDAIDSLFPRNSNGRPRSRGRLCFTYDGYRITVTSDGEVQIHEPGET